MSPSLTPAHVRVRAPDGGEVLLYPGELIGRVPTAALLVDDPRVSEAHALVSLRRGRLMLLALRRMVLVEGRPVREVALAAGLRVELATGLAIDVLEARIPERVLAVEAQGLGLRRLGPVASLFGGATPRLLGRFDAEAPAHVWSLGAGWRARVGGESRAVAPGDAIEIDGVRFAFVEVDRPRAASSTRGPEGHLAPMRIVTFYDGVEIHRAGHPVVTIGGLGARILSELAALGGPVPWQTVAEELWPDARQRPEVDLRQRWDAALRRLRRKLRDAHVRSDLVRADHSGFFQLVLAAGDALEDRA